MKPNTNLLLAALGLASTLILSPAALLAANPHPHQQTGTIKSIDPTARTLVMVDLKNHAEHKFQWNDQTTFSERGKTTAAATDLKTGEQVRVTYSQGGDTPTIQRVHITPAKTEKSAKS